MSTYPYILLPQLLLDFMAAYSTSVGAEVGEAARCRGSENWGDCPAVGCLSEQLPNRIPRSPIKTTPNRQWLTVRVQLKWVALRHILMLLPGIILSYAALVGWVMLGAFGNWGALVLIGYSSGWAICLWQQRNAMASLRDATRMPAVGIAPYLLGSSLDYTSNKPLTLPEGTASKVNPVAVPSASSESASLQKLKQLKKALNKQVRQPSGVSDAPVGASERDFNKVLEQYFPGRVLSSAKVPICHQRQRVCLQHRRVRLCLMKLAKAIDCEIDEPYDYKSRRPTHCIDQQE